MSLISKRRGTLGGRLVSLKWQHYWNRDAARAQARLGRAPEGEGARMLADLKRDGIAICPLNTLVGEASLFEELAEEVARIETSKAQALEEARRKAAGSSEEKGKSRSKSFLWRPLGDDPPFDPESIFLRIALHPQIVPIANGYLGVFSELRYFGVWRSLCSDAPPSRSQLWHRDRDDQRIVKAFVYLSDVEEGHGPFVYAPGTHDRGQLHPEPESFKEAGHGNLRSTDEQMAKVVPASKWIQALGSRGTLILADTTGYHRGGLARIGDRLLFTFMFVSPLSQGRVGFTPAASWSEEWFADDPAVAWAARRGRPNRGTAGVGA